MRPSPLPYLGLALLASALVGLIVAVARPEPIALPTAASPAQAEASEPLTVAIADGDTTHYLETSAGTVGEALWQAGYRLYRADAVEPAYHTPLVGPLTINVLRSRPLMIQADGRLLPTRTRSDNVGGVLSEVGLALVGEDYSVPAVDQPLPVDGIIRVVRVREDVLAEQVVVPFETVYQALPGQEIDTLSLVRAGQAGLRQRRIRIRYEDGVEVSRVDEGETLALAPTPRILGYGTQITLRVVETADGPLEYWRAYDMYATSYAAKFLSRPASSPNYGRTASGKFLTKGLVAIDRRYIPFGTRMYVPGYGFAEAADTGGGVKGRWIDLGFDDWNYESWHRSVTVYFLTPVPPASQIVWIIPSTVP